jgi:aspartyl-tRNA(Asn)/glutamyl-tRNA(Gln) amidotransferase subunit A
MPTRAGSDAFERLAPNDACAVARLRRAGAVIVAKVSTHEFALGVTSPQSRNPHDATRIPGGSSGGSAISVATGMGLASLGTDTRASIRVPAALSGVVGFKPTYGSVPTDGVVPLSWTMDHVALMAVTVADAAAVLDALFGPDSALASVMPRAGVRVAVAEAGFEGADPLVADVIDEALRSLSKAGAALVAAGRPNQSDLALANAAGLVISRSEAATYHRALGSDQSRYWEEVAEQLSLAAEVPAVDYIHAQRLRAELADGLLAEFDHADVVAMPTAPVLAPPADDFAAYLMILARNAIPWSLVGFPAISVPCGKVGALPVGLQLVAPPGREDRLVAVGKALELALG